MTEFKPWSKPDFTARTKQKRTMFDIGESSIISRKRKIDDFVKVADEKINEERSKDEAKKQGFEEGKRTGFEAGKAEWDHKLIELQKLIDTIPKQMQPLTEIYKKEILDLSVLIAKNIVRKELSSSHEFIEKLVEECIELLPKKSHEVKILLNPQDKKSLEDVNYLQKIQEVSDLTIVEDEKIQVGGCKIETEVTEIDATLENRISEVIDGLYVKE